MKKSLTILTIAILAIVAFASCVNAASVTTSATQVKVGDTVTVTVKTENQVTAMEFEVAYDASKYEYVSASGAFEKIDEDKITGKVFVQAYNAEKTSDSVTLTFKALAATEGTGETFTVNDFKIVGAAQEALSNNPATVVVEAAKGDDEGDNTQGGSQGGDNETEKNYETKKDKNGNDINELPKTGTPIFAGAIALIAISGAVLVIKNRK